MKFPGKTLRFTNDFSVLVEEIAAAFPQQIDGFRKLVTTIETFDELNLNQQAVSAMQVVSEHITDPLLVDMLFCPLMFYGSATPRDMDFNQFVVMFKSIFKEGFARPFEGVRRILKTLTRHYKELGGELKLRHGVREIKIDNGRAIGVVLDDGREITADNVLSTIGSVETFRLCGDSLAGQNVPGDHGSVESFQHGAISFNESISVSTASRKSSGTARRSSSTTTPSGSPTTPPVIRATSAAASSARPTTFSTRTTSSWRMGSCGLPPWPTPITG